MNMTRIIPLADGGRAELQELQTRWWGLKHHQKGGSTYLGFYHSRKEAEAALAYLAINGTLPPYPDEEDDDIPY